MHYVLARITVNADADADAADTARAILMGLVAQSRQEPGCVAYELYQQADMPHVFQTVEHWKDQAAADAPMSTAHVVAAIAAVGPLLAAPPEIVSCTKLM